MSKSYKKLMKKIAKEWEKSGLLSEANLSSVAGGGLEPHINAALSPGGYHVDYIPGIGAEGRNSRAAELTANVVRPKCEVDIDYLDGDEYYDYFANGGWRTHDYCVYRLHKGLDGKLYKQYC